MLDLSAKSEVFDQEFIRHHANVDKLQNYLRACIVGQEALLSRLLITLFAGGHVLLEGMPGLAKTLAAKSLAEGIHSDFKRIQFTPDILPADVLGTSIYDAQSHEFSTKFGPVFTNFLLADEINRAPEKVQSALLEVMQENQVTIGNISHAVPSPFMVIATQNPIDQGGTFELPEAQMDRFMMKVLLDYPNLEQERLILRKNFHSVAIEKPSITASDILQIRSLVQNIYLDVKIEDYILNLVFCTRQPEHFNLPQLKPLLKYGASPRGSIGLAAAARGHAFLMGRSYCIPDDVFKVARDVLRHRIGLSFRAIAEQVSADEILEQIINHIPLP